MARPENMAMEPQSEHHISLRTAAGDALGIALICCLCVVVINPLGNFPINDDWSFAQAVQRLLATGDFRPTGWTGMTLITQTFWGALFCLPVGFSFNALRLSTLTMALLGILATYFLMRELRQPRWLGIVVALTLAFSPIFNLLSFTFMTDVTYTAITMVTVVCWVRHLRTGSNPAYLIGSLCAVAATLTRQTALCISLAFAVAFILKNGLAVRNLFRAVLPLVLCAVILVVFQRWLATTGRIPALYFMKNVVLRHALTNLWTVFAVARNSYVMALYLGWFLLPVLICVLWDWWKFQREQTAALLICSTVALAIAALFNARMYGWHFLLMPNGVNVITREVIFPNLLHDAACNLNKIPLPPSFWLMVTAFSMVGAILLIAAIGLGAGRIIPKARSAGLNNTEVAGAFLVLASLIYLLPFLVSGFYDRYLVPPIPLLAVGLVGISPQLRAAPKACRFAVITLLLAYGIYAVCGTRDFLTWNRSRWEALHYLMDSQKIQPKDIDGGFEFNGMYLYDSQYQPSPPKSWWWVQNDTYRIGFGNMPGYTVIKEYAYYHWLPPYAGRIVILKEDSLKAPVIRGN